MSKKVRSRKSEVRSGFTLVEALISITVLALVGIIMVALLNQSFQLNSKSQLVSKIKQNGQNVLNIIDETVRNADEIACPQPNPYPTPGPTTDPNVLVTAKNGSYTRFIIHNPVSGNNGYLGQETALPPASADTTYCYIDATSTSLAIPVGANEAKLTDTNTKAGVSLTNGIFSATGNNLINLQFDLGEGVQAPSNFASKTNPLHFQTSLILRKR